MALSTPTPLYPVVALRPLPLAQPSLSHTPQSSHSPSPSAAPRLLAAFRPLPTHRALSHLRLLPALCPRTGILHRLTALRLRAVLCPLHPSQPSAFAQPSTLSQPSVRSLAHLCHLPSHRPPSLGTLPCALSPPPAPALCIASVFRCHNPFARNLPPSRSRLHSPPHLCPLAALRPPP
jgi:hypothetical protein